ncbi:hypothetical protein [Chromobacterium subtsugae]|uniref:hypothetical protein n=1 Tax=Chromobacterium subtsugae TaxID=251747 RepID=UPI0012D47231|nr:hypothetical protein [Chromobacterium subtsugae]
MDSQNEYLDDGECGKIASPTLSAAIGRAFDLCRAAVAMQDPKGESCQPTRCGVQPPGTHALRGWDGLRIDRNYANPYTAEQVLNTPSLGSAPRLNRGIFAPTFSSEAALRRLASGQCRVAVAIQDPQGESNRLSESSVQPPGTLSLLNKAKGELNKSLRRTDMSAISSRASSDADILARLRRFPSIAPLIDAALRPDTCAANVHALNTASIRLQEARMLLTLALSSGELLADTPACNALIVLERLLEQVDDLLAVALADGRKEGV